MIGVAESSPLARDGGRWTHWLLVLVCLAAAACDRTETTDPEAEAMSPDQKRGTAARPEATTTLEGLLVVDLMPAHGKTTQGTWLHTDDGTPVELGRIDPDISAASPGKRTVGGVLSRTDDGWRLAVRAWAICEGRAPRCGVEQP